MWVERVKDQLELLLKCQTYSLCSWCCLRFLKIHDQLAYQLPKAELDNILHGLSSEFSLEKESPSCFTCFDSMYLEVPIADIHNLNAQYTGTKSIFVSLSLPNQQLARDHFVRLKTLPSREPVELRDALRWRFSPNFPPMADHPNNADLIITICLTHPETAPEAKTVDLLDVDRWGVPHRYPQATKKILTQLKPENFLASYTPLPVTTTMSVSLTGERAHLFVGGRYRKLKRGVPQSAWLIGGERKGELSVAEVIGEVVTPGFQADGSVFSSAGREDIDVKMLGSGRPFVLTLKNAKLGTPSQAELEAMTAQINSSGLVEVLRLQRVEKTAVDALKAGEVEKRKTYRCVVNTSIDIPQDKINELNQLKDIQVDQKTPLRVLHRRSQSARAKIVHSINAVKIQDCFYRVDLSTSAGTYVKEFIHGDLGRTTPSFGSLLGCRADILQLDVLEIDLEFP